MRGQTEPRTQLRSSPFRPEKVSVYSQGLVNRMPHSKPIQVFTHQPTGREDYVEPLVQPTDVAADGPLAQAANSASHELREIRVIERSERDASATRDNPCAPRR